MLVATPEVAVAMKLTWVNRRVSRVLDDLHAMAHGGDRHATTALRQAPRRK